MVSQQICPACATPNSTYASKCRNCATPLNPRPLPGDPTSLWTAQPGQPAAPSQRLDDGDPAASAEYEAAPRVTGSASPAGAGHDPWPAESLTPSRVEEGHTSGLWSSLARQDAHPPSANGHPWPSPPTASDKSEAAPAVYEAPPPSPAAAPDAGSPASWRSAAQPAEEETEPSLLASPEAAATEPGPQEDGPGQSRSLSFHLDGGAGAALGNGHLPPSAPTEPARGTEPPALTSTDATPAPSPAPGVVEEDGAGPADTTSGTSPIPSPTPPVEQETAPPAETRKGGRGWGIREAHLPTPARAPNSSATPNAEAGPIPSSAAYSAGTPFFGPPPMASAAPPGTFPWAASPARARSSAVKGLFAVLVLVLLLFAGGFWYFAYGPGAPKLHTVSAPATLGGLQENNSGAIGQVTSAFQAKFAGEAHVSSAVYSFYGDGQSVNGYLLGLFAFDGTVHGADLANLMNGFDTGASSSFDLSAASATAQGGVIYRCGPVGFSSLTGSLCVWSDVNVIGVTIGLPGESGGATLSAAEEARSTAEH